MATGKPASRSKSQQGQYVQRLGRFVTLEVGRLVAQPQRSDTIEQRIVGFEERRRQAQSAEPRQGEHAQPFQRQPQPPEREPQQRAEQP